MTGDRDCTSLRKGHTAVHVDRLAGDEGAVLCSKEHTHSSALDGLARATHGSTVKPLDVLFGERGRRQRRVDRSWCNSIDSNLAIADDLVGKSAVEGDDGALGRGVLEQVRAANEGVNGSHVDDAAARRHVLECCLASVEIVVDVQLESILPLLAGQGLDLVVLKLPVRDSHD